jgi:hypothetical protein
MELCSECGLRYSLFTAFNRGVRRGADERRGLDHRACMHSGRPRVGLFSLGGHLRAQRLQLLDSEPARHYSSSRLAIDSIVSRCASLLRQRDGIASTP